MANPPDPEAASHELAAIMFSDIAGYTAIMGRDEQAAIRALDAHRGTLRTLLPKFNGRLVGEIGDGTLSSFRSAIDAVNCARQVQALAADSPELSLRIGIHLGDVVFTNSTVIGDGVNVASRIHALASPGGICISAGVYDEIRNKPGIGARDLGDKRLKNVSRPVRVYALTPEPAFEHAVQAGGGAHWATIAAGVGLLAIVVLLYFDLTRKSATPPPAAQVATAPHAIRSIAVLPLDNYSGDPSQEYFADGMTDELTTDLAMISALRVISRGSVMQFKGARRPPTPEIAKMLNVDAVVEGSVTRSGDKVRITAQLIDARADKHLWAKSYQRDSRDVLALQDQLASAIAKEINVELTPNEQERLTAAPTVNPAAHDAYLKGRFFISRPSDENVTKAIALFEEAVKLDPNFAPAYSGLSDAYVWAGWDEGVMTSAAAMPLAKATADKAAHLDDNSAEAHTSLAVYKLFYEFDWAGSENEFRRAFALDPNYAFAHDQFGLGLALHGRLGEAAAEGRRAIELDPLSPQNLANLGLALLWQGKYQEAIDLTDRASDLDPAYFVSPFTKGWIDIETGKTRDAIPELQKADSLGSPSFTTAWLGYAYGASGDRPRAMATIDELHRKSLHGYIPPFNLAIVYLGMGDRDRAMVDLERAYAANSQWMCWLKMDRVYDPLRSDPRFIALMKRLNFEK